MRRSFAATVLSAAALVLLTAAPASAHSELESSTPEAEAQVATAASVRLEFDEPVQLAGTGLQVRDEDGELVASTTSTQRGTEAAVDLPDDLAKGVYTVGWVVRSGDVDIVSGSYQFTLTAGEADSGGTSCWVLAAGAVIVLGGVGLVLAARRRSRTGAVVAGMVLVAAALLLVSRTDRSDAWEVDVEADPAEVGLNTVTVTVPDERPADQVDVRLVLDRTHTVVDVPVTATGKGVYSARSVVLPLAGDWRAAVALRTGDRQTLYAGALEVADR